MSKSKKFIAFDGEYEHNHSNVYEVNEDPVYEFGGTSSDRKNQSKKSSLTEELVALTLVLAFCGAVFYYAFNCL